jgi:hypothetical protein
VRLLRFASMAALVVALTACATSTQKYNWGKYDPSLYGYYKNPTTVGELNQTLEAIIKSADTTQGLVPPGIYAEYGYLLMQQGKNQEAVDMFKQEQAHWPESKVFMNNMIKVASIPATDTTHGSPSR